VRRAPGRSAHYKVTLSNDQLLKEFPWDYSALILKIRAKHPDLKQDLAFHAFCDMVKARSALSRQRYLDPAKKTGTSKWYYSANVLPFYSAVYKTS
jgi:hypothetical protein